MNKKQFSKLYQSILLGQVHNIKFDDLCNFVIDLGFTFVRQNGTSHKVYILDGLERPLILQEGKNGCAKPYQIKQIKDIIKRNILDGKENEKY